MTEPASTQDLFKGRHFDQGIIILCIRWYPDVQTQLPGPGPDDGRARNRSGSHDHLAMGAALRGRHEISVSSYGAIRTNCIVPFSVERVGTNIYLCDLLF